MKAKAYLRPVGRVLPAPPRAVGAPERVVRVAGRQDLAFAAFEAIERHADGWIDRRTLSVDDVSAILAEGRPAAADVKALVERMATPRGDIAGLTLDRPRIMGIVNVTPDSFSDGGRFHSAKGAIEHALRLVDEGAEILDIGGESTRPGAEPVSLDEELRRIMPVIEGLTGRTRARISVDTRKSEVMRRAAAAGVHILNDISALAHDPVSMRAAAETRLAVVLMHSLGDPREMQKDPRYDNAVLDIFDALEARVEACVRAGIPRYRIIVDPGIGFGKTVDHNLALLGGLAQFHGLGTAILLGASRKSFIGALTGAVDPAERMPGSVAAALAGALHGAQILRVHDVAATRQALRLWECATAGASGGVS